MQEKIELIIALIFKTLRVVRLDKMRGRQKRWHLSR